MKKYHSFEARVLEKERVCKGQNISKTVFLPTSFCFESKELRDPSWVTQPLGAVGNRFINKRRLGKGWEEGGGGGAEKKRCERIYS